MLNESACAIWQHNGLRANLGPAQAVPRSWVTLIDWETTRWAVQRVCKIETHCIVLV
jgi:hypothetical protein